MTAPSRERPERRDRAATIRTFLLADIRGYTRFTAQLGDEAASRLAARFAEIVAEAAEAWGGRLVEATGDEALATFESGRAALRAAVELQEAFADETAAEPNVPLRVGIGLDAGEAVPVGEGYRGAALNLAARLCSAADAGEILATDGLVHLAGPIEGLTYIGLDGRPLKGFDEPVRAVRVADSDPHEHAPLPLAGVDAGDRVASVLPVELDSIVPLAGRDADLRWLRWYWRRARHGHGGMVVLAGSAGMGRTRLCAELAGGAVHDGSTVAYLGGGTATPDALREALASGAQLVIVDNLDAAAGEAAPRMLRVDAGPRALVVVTLREGAPSAIATVIDRHVPPERQRTLGPLGPEGVRAIAALYAERSIDDLPLELIAAESEGVPAAVHRVASQWARSAATRRLGESAQRAARGRSRLRDAEAEVIGDVTDLERIRERAQLYVSTAEEDEGTAERLQICPYKGLAAFEPTDAEYFFGREQLVGELIARLVGTSFVALVGTSGSGKSSALRAGLLPALAGGVLPGSEGWMQVVMRPGERPLAELRAALMRAVPEASIAGDDPERLLDRVLAGLPAGQRLVLVVDQFEEVFSATRDEPERSTFIELLTTERPGLKVIVAMRADRYVQAAAFPQLARLLTASQVLVGPLSHDELTAIIERPALRVGLRVEPELTAALLTDAGSEPAALPLLSTALLELWQARSDGRLTLAAYRATGGIQGAVARLAEAAYGDLDLAERQIARGLLLRLAGGGVGDGVVRRRVRDGELDEAMSLVAEKLTAARLLTSGDGYLEVAHEALLREWPRLRDWLEEDAAGRKVRLHLTDAARDWVARGREPGDLYRGARLAAALDWAAEHDPELNATEREYLDASRDAAEAEAARQRRINRRLRVLLAGVGAFLVAAIGAGAFAAVQGDRAEREASAAQAAADRALQEEARAEREAEAARAAEDLARSRELAASAVNVIDDDASLAKLLALAGAMIGEGGPTLESLSILHRALAADPVVARYSWIDPESSLGLDTDIEEAGQYMLVATGELGDEGYRGFVEVSEVETGTVLWRYSAHAGIEMASARFADDGAVVVGWSALDFSPPGSVPQDGLGVFIWETSTGRQIAHYDLGTCGAELVDVSATNLLVLTVPSGSVGCLAESDPSLELVDRSTGERTLISSDPAFGWATSGDGRYVAFGHPIVVVRDLETGEERLTFDARDDDAVSDEWVRELNEDGSLLLFGDRPIQVWDVEAGEVIASYDGHAGESWNADFAPDGRVVWSTGRDGSLRGWSATTGDELFTLDGAGTGTVSATAGGRVLVADPDSASAVLIDSTLRGEIAAVETCGGFVHGSSLRSAEGMAAFAENCGAPESMTYSVDLDAGELLLELAGLSGQTLEISPDGTRFVRQEGSPLIRGLSVRDIRTGDRVLELDGLCEWDIDRVDEDDVQREETGACEEFPTPPFPLAVWQLHWSPDGSMIAAVDHGNYGGYVAVWDALSGRMIGTLPLDPELGWAASDTLFSPDSSHLIVAHWSTGDRQAYSTETWELVVEATGTPLAGGEALGLAGYASDGSLIAIGNLGGRDAGHLHALDPETLELIPDRSRRQIHDGSVKSAALNDEGTLLVTGGSDGSLRVWDALTFELIHEIPFGNTQVQGVAFVNDRHLAVTVQEGNLLVVTIDPDELLEIAGASLTRGFTQVECERYNFGDECPSLEELRAGD